MKPIREMFSPNIFAFISKLQINSDENIYIERENYQFGSVILFELFSNILYI